MHLLQVLTLLPYQHLKQHTKKINEQLNNKISLATVYNTVHAFEKKGYLKQIPINSNQTYFDTNISDHIILCKWRKEIGGGVSKW